MSRSLNQVTLIGNLTRDPEMRATASGDEVCRFSLALGYNFRSRDGEEIQGVDYVDVTAWGGLARVVNDYCHKGKQVFVGGSLRSSSWEQDGQKRSKLEVRATNIILLGSGGGDLSAREDDGVDQPASNKTKTKASKTNKADQETEVVQEWDDIEDYGNEEINPEDIPF